MKINIKKGARERVEFSRIKPGEFFESGIGLTSPVILCQRVEIDDSPYNTIFVESGYAFTFTDRMVTRLNNIIISYSHDK